MKREKIEKIPRLPKHVGLRSPDMVDSGTPIKMIDSKFSPIAACILWERMEQVIEVVNQLMEARNKTARTAGKRPASKGCRQCRHFKVPESAEPCSSCHGHNNWETA